MANCTVGRVVHEDEVLRSTSGVCDGGYKLVAVELLFDRVLTCRERYAFTFSINYSGIQAPREDLFRHIQVQPCELLALTMEFKEQRPEQLNRSRWTGDLKLIDQQPLDLDAQGRYRQVIANPVPGAYGWTWTGAADLATAVA